MKPGSFPANQFLIGLLKAARLFILVKFDSSRQSLKNYAIEEKRLLLVVGACYLIPSLSINR